MKTIWASRTTTVFPRQGHYALDRQVLVCFPQADVTIVRIVDLLNYDLSALRAHRDGLRGQKDDHDEGIGRVTIPSAWNGLLAER